MPIWNYKIVRTLRECTPGTAKTMLNLDGSRDADLKVSYPQIWMWSWQPKRRTERWWILVAIYRIWHSIRTKTNLQWMESLILNPRTKTRYESGYWKRMGRKRALKKLSANLSKQCRILRIRWNHNNVLIYFRINPISTNKRKMNFHERLSHSMCTYFAWKHWSVPTPLRNWKRRYKFMFSVRNDSFPGPFSQNVVTESIVPRYKLLWIIKKCFTLKELKRNMVGIV